MSKLSKALGYPDKLKSDLEHLQSRNADTPPRHAPYSVHTWLEGKDLCIRFADSHTIRIDTARMRDGAPVWPDLLFTILQEQARDARPIIASAAAPVQYDIEAAIRRFRAERPENFQSKPSTPIEALDLSDLEF